MLKLFVSMRLTDKEFDIVVKDAIRLIPREIRRHLDNIVISVKKRPSKRMMREMGLSPQESLLGVFHGVPLVARSATWPPLYPDTIVLFQEPLEEVCKTREELERQISITVVHEVAHFVGIGEKRLRELGCA